MLTKKGSEEEKGEEQRERRKRYILLAFHAHDQNFRGANICFPPLFIIIPLIGKNLLYFLLLNIFRP